MLTNEEKSQRQLVLSQDRLWFWRRRKLHTKEPKAPQGRTFPRLTGLTRLPRAPSRTFYEKLDKVILWSNAVRVLRQMSWGSAFFGDGMIVERVNPTSRHVRPTKSRLSTLSPMSELNKSWLEAHDTGNQTFVQQSWFTARNHWVTEAPQMALEDPMCKRSTMTALKIVGKKIFTSNFE